MVEFADFHADPARGAEDPAAVGAGGRRGHGGGGALHCPRCGRPVTDMHGVCRQCGEVAFQCCQCRHINYESLEAFLCVECGYCAYAHFSFRLIAALETDFTPVTTEAELAEANRLADKRTQLARNLQQELERLRPRVCQLVASLTGVDNSAAEPAGGGGAQPSYWNGAGWMG
ncbi:unnamed protein product, partial [Ectocarpus fasciculatus]